MTFLRLCTIVLLAGLSQATVAPLPATPRGAVYNLSTRGRVSTDDGQSLIAGFVIEGGAPLKLAVRGLGPTLQNFGLSNTAQNTEVSVFSGSSVLHTNDSWRACADPTSLTTRGIQPGVDSECTAVVTLNPGSYTAIVHDKGTGGTGLVDIFNIDDTSTSRLTNVSTRGFVGTDAQVLIAGIIVTEPCTVLLRGQGPNLANFSISGAVANPKLTLYSGQTVLASNDSWADGNAASRLNSDLSSLRPAYASEPALLADLQPGAYTAILEPAPGSSTGIGLVEVFDVTPPPPVVIAPAITAQPASITVTAGATATFSVTASGSAPLAYQWHRNGIPIPNTSQTSYTTHSTTTADSGALFSVTVSNSAGSATSANATLTVTPAPQPNHFYVDPINGADTGDGSFLRPWRSLQTVIETKVETQTWEGSLPYTAGKRLVPMNPGATVKAGATIWLMSGYNGALAIRSAYNATPITIASMPGHTPRFSNVLVQSSQNWILRGFSVSPSYAATYNADTIVTVENHNWRGPASDITIEDFDVFSVPDERVWTTSADWNTKAANAIYASAARVTVRDCRTRNTNFGISMTGQGAKVERNTVDGFCGDGLRGLGDDSIFEYNLVKNQRVVNGNHADGFQSWSTGADGNVGTGVVRNITLRGNVFIAYDNPNLPFVGSFQGIGCFDGIFENWLVENNVIISDTYHGISFYGARNVRIVNNTVLDLDSTNTINPWILITDHKSGTPSSNCVVRNNLTTTMNVSANATNGIVVDHNLVIPKNAPGFFVDVANHNLHLAAGSPAIDQGSSTGAPTIDADKSSRPKGSAVDLGAYEYGN